MSEFVVISPSRHRVANMPALRKLLPDGYVLVDEAEAEVYSKAVGAEHVVTHTLTPNLGLIRQRGLNWGWQRAPWVVMIDDDFRAVRCIVGRRPRLITEADAIRRIVDNALQVAEDLDVTGVDFTKSGNPTRFDAARPYTVMGRLDQSFAVHRDARVRYRGDVTGHEGIDLTLQAYVLERIVLGDERYQFDCGEFRSGLGGLQGVRNKEMAEQVARRMLSRWRPYLTVKPGTLDGWKWGVTRRSPLASLR